MIVTAGQLRLDLAKRARSTAVALIAASCVAALALAAVLPAFSLYMPAAASSAAWLALPLATATAVLLAVVTSFARNDLARFSQAEGGIRSALSASNSATWAEHLAEIDNLARRTRVVKELKSHFATQLDLHLERILQKEARVDRQARVEALCRTARTTLATRVAEDRANSPIVLANRRLVDAIANLKLHRTEAEKQLDRQREGKWLTLWFDLTRPDFAEVDAKIAELEVALCRLRKSGVLESESARYDVLAARIEERTKEIECAAIKAIPSDRSEQFDEDRILRNATWLAAFSVPVSAWGDFSSASDVYDSLR